MAVPAGMVGIREWLRRQGAPDEAIGWQDGTVTLYGQPYFRPSVNIEGRTYARPEELPDVARFRLSQGAFSPPRDMRIQPRSFSPQVQQAIDEIMSMARRGGFTAEDIMRSPEWRSMQRVLDLESAQRQEALRQQFASRGFLRSTPEIQALAAEEARFEAARAQALPQLLQAAYARQQQDLQQRLAALQALAGLEERAFQQGLSEFQTLAPYQYLPLAQQTAYTGFLPGGGMTLTARQAIAELTGVDPVTGQPTFAAREAEAQRRFQAQQAAQRAATTQQTQAERDRRADIDRLTQQWTVSRRAAEVYSDIAGAIRQSGGMSTSELARQAMSIIQSAPLTASEREWVRLMVIRDLFPGAEPQSLRRYRRGISTEFGPAPEE